MQTTKSKGYNYHPAESEGVSGEETKKTTFIALFLAAMSDELYSYFKWPCSSKAICSRFPSFLVQKIFFEVFSLEEILWRKKGSFPFGFAYHFEIWLCFLCHAHVVLSPGSIYFLQPFISSPFWMQHKRWNEYLKQFIFISFFHGTEIKFSPSKTRNEKLFLRHVKLI